MGNHVACGLYDGNFLVYQQNGIIDSEAAVHKDMMAWCCQHSKCAPSMMAWCCQHSKCTPSMMAWCCQHSNKQHTGSKWCHSNKQHTWSVAARKRPTICVASVALWTPILARFVRTLPCTEFKTVSYKHNSATRHGSRFILENSVWFKKNWPTQHAITPLEMLPMPI